MNTTKRTGTGALLAALAMTGATAFGALDIPMVKVGDAGNAADPATDGSYGAVSYDYYIGTYEVTNAQYTAFLNAVAQQNDTYNLYNVRMGDNATYGGQTKS
jgi:hypothetical protein